MSREAYQLDGTVRIEETVTYYRYVPQQIYEINLALAGLEDEQMLKIMKYIMRITGRRWAFRSLEKGMSKKKLFRAMKKMDSKVNGK